MRRSILPSLLSLAILALSPFLVSIPGCGGGSDSDGRIPAAAREMDAEMKTRLARFLPLVVNLDGSLVFVLNPGLPMSQGVTATPDTSPGAPPNTMTFSGPYDGNGDGYNETDLSGSVTFASDPASGWSGAGGQAAFDVAIPVLGHVYHGDVKFSIQSDQRQLSGSGTFTEPVTGKTTTMTIPESSPLVIRDADGTASAVANACGYSLDGRVRLDVTGPDGTLTTYWNFDPDSSIVSVDGATFTDSTGATTALPDSIADLRCGAAGSINDWVGTFDQSWACLPYESGQFRLSIVVSAPDTITITDEDTSGSGGDPPYQAMVLGDNNHAVRGFFIDGPVGSRYREDFNWTLRRDGSGYYQVSRYAYIEGPNTGNGGICAALAKRVP